MPTRGTAMPKKRPKAKPTDTGRKQYNTAFDPVFAARIDATAEALGLDSTHLLRMIIRENFAPYEQRADAVRRGEKPNA